MKGLLLLKGLNQVWLCTTLLIHKYVSNKKILVFEKLLCYTARPQWRPFKFVVHRTMLQTH